MPLARPSGQPATTRRLSRGVWSIVGGLVLAVTGLHAQQPTGGTVVSGSATITAGASSTVITAGNNSILHWNSFNVGADQTFSVSELAKAVCKVMGQEGKIRYLDARNEVAHAYSDHSKAHKVFGLQKATSLEEGLGKMAAWARKAGVRKSSKFSNIEITEKLPPLWLE